MLCLRKQTTRARAAPWRRRSCLEIWLELFGSSLQQGCVEQNGAGSVHNVTTGFTSMRRPAVPIPRIARHGVVSEPPANAKPVQRWESDAAMARAKGEGGRKSHLRSQCYPKIATEDMIRSKDKPRQHLCYVYASLSRLDFRGIPEKLIVVFEGVTGFPTGKKPTALMMHWWNGGRGGVCSKDMAIQGRVPQPCG